MRHITDRQIEASRVAMTRFIKRGGKIWLRLFPDKPITKKPAEVRMGSGKGPLDHWVAVVRPGQDPVRDGRREPEIAQEAMRLASHKLPLKTKFVHVTMRGGQHAEVVIEFLAGRRSRLIPGGILAERRRLRRWKWRRFVI